MPDNIDPPHATGPASETVKAHSEPNSLVFHAVRFDFPLAAIRSRLADETVDLSGLVLRTPVQSPESYPEPEKSADGASGATHTSFLALPFLRSVNHRTALRPASLARARGERHTVRVQRSEPMCVARHFYFSMKLSSFPCLTSHRQEGAHFAPVPFLQVVTSPDVVRNVGRKRTF